MTIPPAQESIEAEAEKLAGFIRSTQAGKCRLAHTERMWFYRAYQGGEPYSSIDWRQSGRVDELLVREHEPLTHRKVLFQLASAQLSPSRSREAEVVALALAFSLAEAERPILLEAAQSKGLLARRPIAEAWARTRAASHEAPTLAKTLVGTVRHGCLVALADFSTAPDTWHEAIKGLSANDYSGVLIQVGAPLPADLPLRSLLRNLDWPCIVWHDDQSPEDVLPELYGLALKQSL